MKIFKKLMLSMLIVCSTYSMSFGMKYGGLWHEFCEAASDGNINKIKICLEKLKDQDLRSYFIRAKDESGYTALLYATMHNHKDIIRILIEAVKEQAQKVALITDTYVNNLTALNLALIYRHPNVVIVLLEYYKQLGLEISPNLLEELKSNPDLLPILQDLGFLK